MHFTKWWSAQTTASVRVLTAWRNVGFVYLQLSQLSMERVSFGNMPLFSQAHRMVFVINRSKTRPISFQWHVTSQADSKVSQHRENWCITQGALPWHWYLQKLLCCSTVLCWCHSYDISIALRKYCAAVSAVGVTVMTSAWHSGGTVLQSVLWVCCRCAVGVTVMTSAWHWGGTVLQSVLWVSQLWHQYGTQEVLCCSQCCGCHSYDISMALGMYCAAVSAVGVTFMMSSWHWGSTVLQSVLWCHSYDVIMALRKYCVVVSAVGLTVMTSAWHWGSTVL